MRKVREIIFVAHIVFSVLIFYFVNNTKSKAEKNIKQWANKTLGLMQKYLDIKHKIYGAPSKEPCIFVCNHTSVWETIAFYAIVQQKKPVVYVAKIQMKNIPILGVIMRNLGCVFVDRDNPDLSLFFSECKKAIQDNRSIVIFPEGTREKVDDIKSGAILLAKKMQVPMQVVIHDAGKIFSNKSVLGSKKGEISIYFGEYISPNEKISYMKQKIKKAFNIHD